MINAAGSAGSPAHRAFLRRLAAALAVAVTLALTPVLQAEPAEAATCAPFPDVTSRNQHCANIDWLKSSGITKPDDGRFHPSADVTRGAMTAFLYRLKNPHKPAPKCTGKPFPDVKTSDLFCGYIQWAKKHGVAQGYPDGKFRDDNPVTRGAMAAFLTRIAAGAADTPACAVGPYLDVPRSHEFCRPITWMAAHGITFGVGDGTRYAPADQVTRQAMASFLRRLHSHLQRPTTPGPNPSAAVPNGAHPRMILDGPTLTALRAAASGNTAEWKAVKAVCDKHVNGKVEYPSGASYPGSGGIGAGYQGGGYVPPLAALGICYQVLKTSQPAAAKKYGQRGVDVLVKMSTPYRAAEPANNGTRPCTDSGYGIRNYGVGFGLGYDWLHDLLTPAQRRQVYTTANAWLADWEKPGGCADFAYKHPQSNYYAGYFHAKAVISMGTYGDNPLAPAQWNDWLQNQFLKRVQPYHAANMAGGAWPEGYSNYADLGLWNMSMPIREVKTATGLNLLTHGRGYTLPVEYGEYAMHFTWPSRGYFDDRDTNRQPGDTHVGLFTQAIGEAEYWGSPLAPALRAYRAEVRQATDHEGDSAPWVTLLALLRHGPTGTVSSLPRSFLAPGIEGVAARSSWAKDATWMSFRAGPYVNNPDQGEQYFDAGGPSFVRGGTPLLVNASGWIVDGVLRWDDGEGRVYEDNFGSGGVERGNRQLYNVFYVRSMSGGTVETRYGQNSRTRAQGARTGIAHFDDGGSYVYTQATHLEDRYRTVDWEGKQLLVAGWEREIVYLRPNRFVVLDRTKSGKASYDQFLAWHFPANPTVSTSGGTSRMDVTYQGRYAGSATVVTPGGATVHTSRLYPSSPQQRVWRAEVRPTSGAVNQNWITVFDLSASKAKTATATPVTHPTSGVIGTQLTAGDGNSVVVSASGIAGQPKSGTITYRVSAMTAEHVISGLPAGAGYTVTGSVSGGAITVKLTPGGTVKTSSAGVLSFTMKANGRL